MRRHARAVHDSIDLIAIALVATDELVERYEERVDLSGLEQASAAQQALATLLASAKAAHEQRYSVVGCES